MEGKMPNAGNKLVIEMAPWTNGDAIRDMTDEELAEFLKEQTSLAHNYGYECADGEPDFPDGIPANYDYLTWLRQEEAKE